MPITVSVNPLLPVAHVAGPYTVLKAYYCSVTGKTLIYKK